MSQLAAALGMDADPEYSEFNAGMGAALPSASELEIGECADESDMPLATRVKQLLAEAYQQPSRLMSVCFGTAKQEEKYKQAVQFASRFNWHKASNFNGLALLVSKSGEFEGTSISIVSSVVTNLHSF